MKKLSNKRKTLLLIFSFLLIIILVLGIYRMSKIKLFDRSAYYTLNKNLKASSEAFESQKDLKNFIIEWADTQNLKYEVDDENNIIFTENAISKKKNISPTVVLVNYNFETAYNNSKVLTSAAMITQTKIKSSKTTVIFVNNENNNGKGYYNLDKKYFPNKSKVIYLDYGKYMYVSNKSFTSAMQSIVIPTKTTSVHCDSAVKIKIKGLESDDIDTSISNRTNLLSTLSSILTRLKSKSTICQIADIKLSNKYKMYPDGLEITILLNSYSIDSFTKYLDKSISKFEKKYSDNEKFEYTYKIIKKKKKLPKKAYSKKTFNALTTLLFSVKNGAERFDEESVIPKGYEIKDINTITSPCQLRNAEDGNLYLDVYTQAVNSDYLNKATRDNSTVAKLSNCKIYKTTTIPSFSSKNKKFLRKLQRAYFKVSDLYGANFSLELDADTYFTPMSYLHKINTNMDIVHIKENSKSAGTLTNMIICYIQTRGNILSF